LSYFTAISPLKLALDVAGAHVEENIARRMAPEEARAAAKRSFGGHAQVQEECRDTCRTNHLETTWSDLRYAVKKMCNW
jgi:hypothetical protein